MKLNLTKRFKKAFDALPDDVKENVEKALLQFRKDPRHPGLHFEKLKSSEYRTIRPDRGKYRIVLRGSGQEFDLVDIDRHQAIDRKFG